ncbi:MAG TPA: methylated-DNA--[protein]-cysteine S-methyltransferase [Mycobacteriales bacterium]|nr:methylated-DNA--[protein]-cysteine S-methyltransferase [Mycobacteriales bacterium]
MRTKTLVDSPVGPLTLVADGGVLAGLFMASHRHAPPLDALPLEEAGLPAVREQLAAYFARDLKDFDVPLAVRGTPFQEQVWAALRAIPYGETWSYRELAEAVGRPPAVRAVGLANGRNPVSIVVPCHRVIGSGGALTGYGGGLAAKQWLLDHETGSAAWSSDSLP